MTRKVDVSPLRRDTVGLKKEWKNWTVPFSLSGHNQPESRVPRDRTNILISVPKVDSAETNSPCWCSCSDDRDTISTSNSSLPSVKSASGVRGNSSGAKLKGQFRWEFAPARFCSSFSSVASSIRFPRTTGQVTRLVGFARGLPKAIFQNGTARVVRKYLDPEGRLVR